MLRKKWYREVFHTNCPIDLWEYGYKYIAQIMCQTAIYSGSLEGRTLIELIAGETPDISEYLEFF